MIPPMTLRRFFSGFAAFALTIYLIILIGLLPAALPIIAAQGETPTPPAVQVFTSTPTATIPPTLTPDASLVRQYEPYEVSFTLLRDPRSVEAWGEFTAETGAIYRIPAFWWQGQEVVCTQNCLVEQITPKGEGGWRVRFSPPTPGAWSYVVKWRDGSGTQNVTVGNFRAAPATGVNGAAIRVDRGKRSFAYPDGTPFYPRGVNLGWSWSGARNTQGYIAWLEALAAAGGNFARIYVDVPWFIGLGWRAPLDDPAALQVDSWKLDQVMAAAERLGIRVQLVLVWYQGWTDYVLPPVNIPTTPTRPKTDADWIDNPHNVVRGGPFTTPGQFFAGEQGRALFKARLRYIVGRWGGSRSLFAWEVIDYLDQVAPASLGYGTTWLAEMVSYLRDIDPYDRLITAGVRDPARMGELTDAALDFYQLRYYQQRPVTDSGDQFMKTLDLLTPYLLNGDRPLMISEFSLNPWFEPAAEDPTGVHLRETYWAAAMAGIAGSPLSWWWDTYLFPNGLTDALAPLAAWERLPLGAMEGVNTMLIGASAYEPITISGFDAAATSRTPPNMRFRITADGVFPPIRLASSYLYGKTFPAANAAPQRYLLSAAVDTKLTVRVVAVSRRAGAQLTVSIDGRPAAELALVSGAFPTELIVPIPAGEHEIVLDNSGDDYLQIESIQVESYRAPLRAFARAEKREGALLAVIQNRLYTWQHAANTSAVIPPQSAEFIVAGMPSGSYRVRMIDLITGELIGSETEIVEADGLFRVMLPPVAGMLSLEALRVAKPETPPTATPTLTPTPELSLTPTARVVG